ncbi:MAG TPA: PIN domain-containing protein [Candidatus Limnocylindria bacterium]|nr:PIN domain-containing protein [Candidatus Limnocylindria bacterium]
MGIAVDANVLLRWLLRDDSALAAQADKILNGAAHNSLILDRMIVAEVSYVLRSYYQYPKSLIVQNLQALQRAPQFSIADRELVDLTIDLFESEKPLSFEDCWLLALKHSGRVKRVETFDKNLLKRLER